MPSTAGSSPTLVHIHSPHHSEKSDNPKHHASLAVPLASPWHRSSFDPLSHLQSWVRQAAVAPRCSRGRGSRRSSPPRSHSEHVDGLLSLPRAAKLIGVSRFSLWRWIRDGLRDKQGRPVRLKHRRKGRRLYTSKAWIDDFHAQLAAIREACMETPCDVSPTQTRRIPKREREIDAAIKRVHERLNSKRHRQDG